jgi:hypothetical protein
MALPSPTDPLLCSAALKAVTLGATFTDAECKAWEALDEYDRSELRRLARARLEGQLQRQIVSDVRTHGEPARRHYATMSRRARKALGLTSLLRAPCGGRHRRAPGTRPTRHRGSRRGAAARAGPSDLDDEPAPPGLRLWRHPRFGSCSPGLLRLLLREAA